jgi:hypothetical protein
MPSTEFFLPPFVIRVFAHAHDVSSQNQNFGALGSALICQQEFQDYDNILGTKSLLRVMPSTN